MQRSKTPKKILKKQISQEKDPVEVFCRLRPIDVISTCVRVQDNVTLVLIPPENSQSAKNGSTIKEVQNQFKFVFNERTTQKLLFNNVALPLVEDVLKGKNALLFAYGVTSSGKTHTMTGSSQDPGILPRCLDVMFNSLFEYQAKKFIFKSDRMNGFEVQTDADAMLERQQRDIMPRLLKPNSNRDFFDNGKVGRVRDLQKIIDLDEDNVFAVFVSYIEIYNNYIYDLLEELPYDPITGTKPPTSKILREDCNRNMYVSTGVEVEVTNPDEAYDLFIKGQNRRRVAHTALNTESSRSHSVFSIRVVQAPVSPNGEEVLQDKEKICVSQLALVDLAGSERTLRTNNQGDRLKEAGCINQSLMVLRNCIEILRENQKNGSARMVPYRDSRLTHLFKNYFDGEGRVRMIVCVNPSAAEYDETIQVMKFAEMTQEVQVARPTGPNFELGFTPGRRKNFELIKNIPVIEKDDLLTPFIFNPAFPKLLLMESKDDKLLVNLILFLKDRERRRFSLLSEIANKEEAFRNNLLSLEGDRATLERRVRELEEESTYKAVEVEKLRKRVNALESNNQVLLMKTNAYERERQDLERQIGDKEWKILREKMEKDHMKQDYKAKLVLNEQQLNQQMEQRQRRLEQETAAQLHAKQYKLDLVRNIINGGEADVPSTPIGPSRLKPVPVQRNGTTKVYPAKSEPDLLNIEGYARMGQTPLKVVPAMRTAPYTAQPIKKTVPRTNRAKSPPPIKPKPSINVKLHRRSRSSGDIWVDHQPKGTQPLNTLVQPKMKKRRSVTNISEKDTKDANKYVLTHQDVDQHGGVATQLIKGNIYHTNGGGTAVIFNDVEVVTQKSPGERKRRSNSLRREDFEGEWTDVENRCDIAIEGHAHNKKMKSSNV